MQSISPNYSIAFRHPQIFHVIRNLFHYHVFLLKQVKLVRPALFIVGTSLPISQTVIISLFIIIVITLLLAKSFNFLHLLRILFHFFPSEKWLPFFPIGTIFRVQICLCYGESRCGESDVACRTFLRISLSCCTSCLPGGRDGSETKRFLILVSIFIRIVKDQLRLWPGFSINRN